MKTKKIIGYTIIGALALCLLGVLGLFTWSRIGTYPAGEIAILALESTGSVSVLTDENITFTPQAGTDTGIIFYPGGLVESSAYAPVLRKIAEDGYPAWIISMPFNLAIFNTQAADAVIDANPQISSWVIAGHSLGGAAAAIYAENHPSKIDAIVFWDSYPPDFADLSDNDFVVISIYGTTNGVPNTENFDEKRPLLPADAVFVDIEGANHSQFGDYGPQKDDVLAAISPEQQHEIVADSMLDFLGLIE